MSRILGPRDGFQAEMSAPTPEADLLLSSVTEVWPAGSMNDEGPTPSSRTGLSGQPALSSQAGGRPLPREQHPWGPRPGCPAVGPTPES